MTEKMTVIIEDMPRELWQQAKTKGQQETPARTLKQIVIALIQDYVTPPKDRKQTRAKSFVRKENR